MALIEYAGTSTQDLRHYQAGYQSGQEHSLVVVGGECNQSPDPN